MWVWLQNFAEKTFTDGSEPRKKRKFSPSKVFSLESFLPRKFSPSKVFPLESFLPRKFSPSKVFSLESFPPRKFSPSKVLHYTVYQSVVILTLDGCLFLASFPEKCSVVYTRHGNCNPSKVVILPNYSSTSD